MNRGTPVISVGKWILETTRPHKHVQVPEEFVLERLFPNQIQVEVPEYFRLYNK